jgi:hypothetical protein
MPSSNLYEKLRNSALTTGVEGALMDLAYPNGSATLVAMADSTVSMYVSSGGGFLGMGERPAVRAAAQTFLSVAKRCADGFSEAASYPLPNPGEVRFYVTAREGVRASEEIDERAIQAVAHALSPLYAAAQALITQIRLVSEAEAGSPPKRP